MASNLYAHLRTGEKIATLLIGIEPWAKGGVMDGVRNRLLRAFGQDAKEQDQMKHKKIIFVCTGNTVALPMAEAALRQELKKRKDRWYQISSAGLRAQEGAPMADHAKVALFEAGIPFSRAILCQKADSEDGQRRGCSYLHDTGAGGADRRKKCHKHGCICRERYSGSVRTGN